MTGCADAIRDAGRQGQIRVISHDLTNETRRLLQEGEIDFTITQDLSQQSYRALIILQEYLQKNITPQHKEHAIDIVCAENLAGRES